MKSCLLQVNTNRRCLSPAFVFADLSHLRTCRSAYGGSPTKVGAPSYLSRSALFFQGQILMFSAFLLSSDKIK